MNEYMTTMAKSIESKLRILSAALIVAMFTLAWSPTLHAASPEVIDISSYTLNAYKMTVLTNGDLAVLDNVDKKIILLDTNGTYKDTLDVSDYLLDPIDITTFLGRIGVLDGTGVPDVNTTYVLLFNPSGALTVSLPSTYDAYAEIERGSEIIGTTDGGYVTYWRGSPKSYFFDHNYNGFQGHTFYSDYKVYGMALVGDYMTYIEEIRNSNGDYRIRYGYLWVWEADWSGDALSEVGTAGFNENNLALLNETQTSLIVFDVQDGYLDRIDGLPTSGLNITDIEGDINANYVYVLADSSIIKVSVPLLVSFKIANFESDVVHLTWSRGGDYQLEFDISPYFNPPTDIVELADTITEYYYDASAAIKGFFRLVKR